MDHVDPLIIQISLCFKIFVFCSVLQTVGVELVVKSVIIPDTTDSVVSINFSFTLECTNFSCLPICHRNAMKCGMCIRAWDGNADAAVNVF